MYNFTFLDNGALKEEPQQETQRETFLLKRLPPAFGLKIKWGRKYCVRKKEFSEGAMN